MIKTHLLLLVLCYILPELIDFVILSIRMSAFLSTFDFPLIFEKICMLFIFPYISP